MLIGREGELQRLAAVCEDARRGQSTALAIVGDAGVGKTALLDDLRAAATDMRQLSATGVESESELPFASLHELLAPVLELLPRIPGTQARALATALALEEGRPNSLAVAAGTFSLLVEAAEEMPLLVVLDDVHWFDGASAEALAFAARRLKAEQVAVIAAFRPDTASASAFEDLPRMPLGPLGPDAARSLLRTRLVPVATGDEGRVLAAAEGNPLVLLELPVELVDELPPSSTQYERLERSFARRLNELPEPARRALLLAAAEPDLQTVSRACVVLGAGASLAPSEAAGLVRTPGSTVVFRHPVVRSLVYSRATADERAAAHGVLAAALEGEADRDRRAWHLGASTDDVDEEVATLLEQTADRAIARGGLAAAGRALERAARLSPEPERRARRLLAASAAERRGGRVAHARTLIEEALPLSSDPLLRFDLLYALRGMNEWTEARDSESVLLRELADPRLDDERRLRLLIIVSTQRVARFDAAGAVQLNPELDRYGSGASADARGRGELAAGIASLLAGEHERATERFGSPTCHPDAPTIAAFDFMSLELFDELRLSLSETLRAAQLDQNLHRISWNRSCAAHLELRHGRLAGAEAAAAEALRVGELLGDPKVTIARTALAGVHAWRGDVEACLENARHAAASARAAGDRFPEGLALGALAQLALGRGRPADAISELEPLEREWAESTVKDPAATPFVPDLIEAYAATGDVLRARDLLGRFAPLATPTAGIWMAAACARCEGVLAADAPDDPFGRAIELLEPSPFTLELARVRLTYGERLRRLGRRRDARAELAAAHETFAAGGATLWRDRAASELRATGVRVTVSSTAPSPVDLTPQERAIATLVAEGKSNKEVAAAVYLSPKTVEYHLANMFRKLNIHSRVELTRLIAPTLVDD